MPSESTISAKVPRGKRVSISSEKGILVMTNLQRLPVLHFCGYHTGSAEATVDHKTVVLAKPANKDK